MARWCYGQSGGGRFHAPVALAPLEPRGFIGCGARTAEREIVGTIRDRGASSMIDTVSNLRHVFGEYC